MGRVTPVGQEEESVKMLYISLVDGPSPQPLSFIVKAWYELPYFLDSFPPLN